MYSLCKPTRQVVEAYRISQVARPVFTTAGKIPDPSPSGFRSNVGADRVGRGPEAFRAAVEAVRNWEMFPAWAQVETSHETVRSGLTAAVFARCCGVWGVNCCRVIELTETDREFAFTYATTDEHALLGVERFSVSWRDNDEVWFRLHSISRPHDGIVWLALPWLRRLQRQFAVDAPAALRCAVERRLQPTARRSPSAGVTP